MHILDYFLLFATVILSGITFFIIPRTSDFFLKLLLSFSGAYLFAISVLHLMPGVYKGGGPGIGIWIMTGFFLQIILEYFSEGIEHGHVHVHKNDHGTFPLTMMISLSLHSFLEGVPLAGGSSGNDIHHHEHSLLYGIILHHIPVAFALVSMLNASGISRMASIIYLTIFALMAPMGALCGTLLQQSQTDWLHTLSQPLMAIVIGIFLHISTTILFESGNDHRFNLYKMVAIITGGLLGLSSLYL
jgi:zinc transporter ZupT